VKDSARASEEKPALTLWGGDHAAREEMQVQAFWNKTRLTGEVKPVHVFGGGINQRTDSEARVGGGEHKNQRGGNIVEVDEIATIVWEKDRRTSELVQRKRSLKRQKVTSALKRERGKKPQNNLNQKNKFHEQKKPPMGVKNTHRCKKSKQQKLSGGLEMGGLLFFFR